MRDEGTLSFLNYLFIFSSTLWIWNTIVEEESTRFIIDRASEGSSFSRTAVRQFVEKKNMFTSRRLKNERMRFNFAKVRGYQISDLAYSHNFSLN